MNEIIFYITINLWGAMIVWAMRQVTDTINEELKSIRNELTRRR